MYYIIKFSAKLVTCVNVSVKARERVRNENTQDAAFTLRLLQCITYLSHTNHAHMYDTQGSVPYMFSSLPCS